MKQDWCACGRNAAFPTGLRREGGPLPVLVYGFRFRQRLNRTVARESARPPVADVRVWGARFEQIDLEFQ
jgi:hypothetical protein